MKLLTYNTRDWKSKPTVTGDMIKEMIDTK
nr:MAG TPA: hypothetical protein [Caudoviricetes sp.]